MPLLYQIALTLIPNIGPVQARLLLQHLNVDEIFKTKKNILEKIEGFGEIRARSIVTFKDFKEAEKELKPILASIQDTIEKKGGTFKFTREESKKTREG